MFGSGKGNFSPMMGELRLNVPRDPFLGQAPAAPAPSAPAPVVTAPAPVIVPSDSGMSNNAQVWLAGGVVAVSLLSAILLSD